MRNRIILTGILGAATTLGLGAGSAKAEDVKCSPMAKKLKWNMCVHGKVEYKRGLKTESRTECTTVKPVAAKGGCNLGDLAKLIPEGVSQDNVVFYAIGPKDFDVSAFEVQKQSAVKDCGLQDTRFEPYMLMKFSEAFDKSNRDRGAMVAAKLHKKKSDFMKTALAVRSPSWKKCSGVKSLIGQVDKKTQSKFLFYAEAINP